MSDAERGQSRAGLTEAVDSRMKRVQTHALDISFNELMDMVLSTELDIRPAYQRVFQWSEGAQSRFIESLLLEMPVPPIYVVEEDEGQWLLIDGLQRISSYLHLRGVLDTGTQWYPSEQAEQLALDNGDVILEDDVPTPIRKGDQLVLTGCDIVEELNGRTYGQLDTALQIRLKRAFVRVEVIRKGSDPRFKYHMFKRLNTGGQPLSNQQVRNCTIRLLGAWFNDYIIDLSGEPVFRSCIETLTPQSRREAFDQELVLRFFALRNYRDEFRHDISDFLTKYMEGVSEPDAAARLPFDATRERDAFLKTFSVLAKTLGEYAFAYANRQHTGLVRGFSVLQFEAFTQGIQSRLDRISLDDTVLVDRLRDTLKGIKLDEAFIRLATGGGKNSRGQLDDRIAFVQRQVEDVVA